MSEDRRRVLDMLAEGTITPEQAESLLRAMSGGDGRTPPPPSPPESPAAKRYLDRMLDIASEGTRPREPKRARSLRIRINRDGDGNGLNVNVVVPLGLVRFASRFLPEEARQELTARGVSVEELLETINAEEGVPEGRLLDLESDEDGTVTSIVIEAV